MSHVRNRVGGKCKRTYEKCDHTLYMWKICKNKRDKRLLVEMKMKLHVKC